MNEILDYPITPVSKPRQTVQDKWLDPARPVVARFRDFRDTCRELKLEIQCGDDITFNLPMPKWWSQKKKTAMDSTLHRQRPDIDNLTKSVMDCLPSTDPLKPHSPGEDCHISHLILTKRWAETGSIIIKRKYQDDS